MRSVGIDIGRYSIKVAVIESHHGSYTVEDYYESPFSTDITHDPYIHTLEVLRRLAASYDPATTKFNLALPQASICTRYKHFPFKERFKVIKSIAFELEDDIPYDQDEAVFDAKILGISGGTSEVLAVATPHEHVVQLLHICEEAGIDPDVISMEASAMANLVESWWKAPGESKSESIESDTEELAEDEEEEQSTSFFEKQNIGPLKLLINIGHSKTLVTAFANSRLVSTHSISYGGKDIVKAIADKYSLSYPEALKTFQEKGFILTTKKGASKDQIYFSDCIAGSLQHVVNETKRFLLSLHADFQFQLDSLHLTGGVSQLLNIGAFFTQHFEVAVNPYQHSLRHKYNKVPVSNSFEHQGGLAIGLAIEGIKLSRNPAINFRQGQLGKQNQNWNFIYEKWGKAMQVGAVFLVSLFLYAPLKNYFSQQVLSSAQSSLRAETKKHGLRGRSAKGSGLKRHIRGLKAQARNASKMSEIKNMNGGLGVLAKLSKLAPKGEQIQLDLAKFDLKNTDLKLEGYVKDQNQLKILDSVVRNLSNGGFEKVRPEIKNVNGKLSFAYKLKVNRWGNL
jgi:general secretion pathway protein L